MPKVLIVEGPQKGRSTDLVVGQNFIGRGDDAHVILASGQVSRRHACLTFSDGHIYIEDLGSSNGTFVNGARVQKVEIRKGNKIRIGEFTMEIVPDSGAPAGGGTPAPGPAPAAPPPPADAGRKRGRGAGPGAPPAAGARRAPPPTGSARPFMGGAASAPDSRFWRLYGPLRVIPWQLQVALVLTLLACLAVFGVLAPSLTQAEQDVSAEALKRAQTLVNALAMKNGEFIKTRNDIYYDTQTFLQNEGVSEAYLLNPEMVILSPPTQRNRVKRNALTNQVQANRELVSLEEIAIDAAEGREGTYHLATPIRVWNTESGRYDIYGYAYLVFRADQVGKAATSRTARLALYGAIIGVASIAALVLIILLTVKPIAALRDDAELALRGDVAQVASRAKFAALSNLAHTMNRALEKGRTPGIGTEMMGMASGMGGAEMPVVAAVSAPVAVDEGLGDAKVAAIAAAVSQGVLILDDMQRVAFLNRRMEQIIGRSAAGLTGRHVMEVMTDPQVLGVILDLFKQILSSPGSVASQPVSLRGQNVNVVVSGVFGGSQELKYAAVVIG